MTEIEKKIEENPYRLSREELICPERGKKAWFDQLVIRQREGVEHGIRPQFPRHLFSSMQEDWRVKVWSLWINRQPPEVHRTIMKTTDLEVEWRWREEDEDD